MVYKVIGLMSGSSLDGLDIAFVEFEENAGKWSFTILASECQPYDNEWKEKLKNAHSLNAMDYLLLHSAYGHYLGEQVNSFIEQHSLQYKVSLICSHGHTVFHFPQQKMTAQLGDGAAIAAVTSLPVVSDLRAMDIAFGGQAAPIVPIGEKYLFPDFDLFLNLGGIANLSINRENYTAFDVCPANRVLNALAAKVGKDYDANGEMASIGNIHDDLLKKLNELPYYKQPAPKSLDNSFGANEVYSLIKSFGLTHNDSLRTYVEHIVIQIKGAILANCQLPIANSKLLVTGGGAFNGFVMDRLKDELKAISIEVIVPDKQIVEFKEALIMALIGILRWRQEYTTLISVTGASRSSIGGALWIGQEA
jgi:anhydro-N-acetylmuramic acid kinase